MRLLAFSAGWLAGLFVASRLGLPPIALLALIPVAVASLVLWRKHRRPVLVVLLAAGVVAGGLRFEWHERQAGDETITSRIGEVVEVRGVVASVPDPEGQIIQLHVRVTAVLVGDQWRPVTGLVRVSAMPTAELTAVRDPPYLRPGDVLRLKGELQSPRPLGEFDFPSYLASQDVRSVMAFPRLVLLDSGQASWLDRAVFAARIRLSTSLERALREPQAGLARALTVGFRDGISPGLSEDFRRSGTSHLLAISGLHVAVVAGMALAISRRLFWRARILAYGIPVIAVWAYALLAGLPPSAQRAAIMASIYLAAWCLGRQRHGFDALLLAAVLITMFSPRALWQVSFQLSFLAMAGITLVSIPVIERVEIGPAWGSFPGAMVRWALYLAITGLAATVFTWPAIALYFQQVSLVGIPATMAAMPLLPLAIGGSLLVAALGVIPGDIAAVITPAIGWPVGLLLSFEVWPIRIFAALPLASASPGPVPAALIWACYACLGLAVALSQFNGAIRARLGSWTRRSWTVAGGWPVPARYSVAVLSIGVASALVWGMALWRPAPILEVDVLDVGQGEAILLKAPSGHVVLVDGGRDGQVLRQALGRNLAFQQRGIDVVAVTHPHEDHAGGLAEGLEGYAVGAVLLPAGDPADDGAAYRAWQEVVRARGIPRVEAYAGYAIGLGEVRIDVLNPPKEPLVGTSSDVDNNGLVLRVSYGRVSFLLTGDIRGFDEEFLERQGLPLASTVLKVAHHGSETSSSPAFVDAVHPRAAVISAGEGNSFGQPHESTMAVLRARVPERAIFITARHGTVRFYSNGQRLWVETERP